MTFDHLAATLLAQGVDSGSVFLQYGAIGATALIFIGLAWKLFQLREESFKQERAQFEKTIEIERESRKRAEDDLRALNASIRDQFVPAMERATGVIAQTLRASRRDDRHDDAAR